MKREADIMKVCAGIFCFILFGVPSVVVGLIENPLLTCALVIWITLFVGAMRLDAKRLEVDAMRVHAMWLDAMWAAKSKLSAVLVNKPNDNGDAGGAVEAGALVPRPPGGRPPTLKAEAALPIPAFNLRAVSLSIRHQTPRQA